MTSTADTAITFASEVDAAAWGEYRRPARIAPGFAGRVTPAEAVPGRFHLYGGWACPASHRLAILRGLAGLEDVVTMSYVDTLRDARGWAFRPGTGPDPVNGFTLLAEAYLATDPGYGGPITVPVLWDRDTGSIRSNSPIGIGLDLIEVVGDGRLRPAPLRSRLDAVSARIATEVESQLGCAVYRSSAATTLRRALAGLDDELTTQRYLVGDRLTDADVRLWVQLVRYDAGANAHNAIGPRLDHLPGLWAWALRLWEHEAFRSTTDFTRFSAPLADLPPWPNRSS